METSRSGGEDVQPDGGLKITGVELSFVRLALEGCDLTILSQITMH